MITKTIKCFDIAQICDSGQCFRMLKKDAQTYSVIAGDRHLEVAQKGDQCIFYCEEDEFESFWKGYFDLDTDYIKYRESIDQQDKYLKEASEFGSGIRILNQDLWEMIVSFLISQQNNIIRIRRCIDNICEKLGKKGKTQTGISITLFPRQSPWHACRRMH